MSAKIDPAGRTSVANSSQRSRFDRHAPTYSDDIDRAVSFSFQDAAFFTKAKADLLVHLLQGHFKEKSGLGLLDVGCGTGTLHPALVAAGLNVSAVDVAMGPLEVARTTNPKVRYAMYDGRSLPFAGPMFDVTLAVCVLHHIPEHKHAALLAEMRRVTRLGGLVCIIEHNPLNPLTRLAVWRCSFDTDAVLLPARKSLAALQAAGISADATRARYFLFSPFDSGRLRAAERHFGWFCLGAQYCAYGINTA